MSAARIAIATVSDSRFLPAACCQLVSVASHLPNDGNVSLFLVLVDVTQNDVRDAETFFRKRGIPVSVILPSFIDRMISPIEARWPRAAYLRLYFDWIFDRKWERIVYFDADTLIRAQLVPLLSADLRGKPIGAVHDFIYYVTGNIHRRRRDLMLAKDAPYFQSGVIVFDWERTLASGGLEAARRFLIEYPERCYEAPDQDALNAAFQDKWTPLDPRWNLHELYLMGGGRLDPYLMHFTSTKPWSRWRPVAWRTAAEWYRRELRDSPWADFVKDQSLLDVLRARLGLAGVRYGRILRHLVASRLPFVLDWIGQGRRDKLALPWTARHSKDVELMTEALILEAARRCPPLRPPEAVLPKGHW
jgi:lipopolysaccharide biosynthesis glycosyltransferase